MKRAVVLCLTFFARVETVVKNLGRTCRLVSQTEVLRRDEYRIAMRVGNWALSQDHYHFMVQLSNGQWAHKQGGNASEIKPANFNPATGDWVLLLPLKYNSKTLFFAVNR